MTEFEDAVETGRSNAQAIELARRHCCHMRIGLVSGNSMVGAMLSLPMGLQEVRCEHAPPPCTQGHQALDLAIEFYEANCPSCPYREGTGELPNLATVARQRADEEAARKDAALQAADERTRRHRERVERRRQLLAGEGHVVRDLGAALDRLDQPDRRTQTLTPDEKRAARHVIDSARGAPDLFRPVLVDSLLEMATDVVDPTAFEAIGALVRAGRCSPRRALDSALVVLRRRRSPEAGRLLAALQPELRAGDLPEVLDQLIALASGEEHDRWRPPSSPEGLIAAANADLPAVTDRVIEHLTSDDEAVREAGADAARILLALDAKRVVALGPPLVASVRGQETAYAGYPHPTSAALRALAEAWRGEPELTCQIIEAGATRTSSEARSELSRVPWFLHRFREPWDASDAATQAAISFLVRRAGGDWGDDAADQAADHLRSLGGDVPEAIVAHVDGLLGQILSLCAPDRDEPVIPADAGIPPALAALERQSLRLQRDARRRHLAETVGRCATANPETVLDSVRALFEATTGDEHTDRAVRSTLLEVLEEAVSPDTIRGILPITYKALLDCDQVVRSGGIDLWAACARVTHALPVELTDLSVPLLEDRYVIVHRRMLEQIPRLHLPADLAPKLLPIVRGWMVTYAAASNPDVLESAIWALRALARNLEDDSQMGAWHAVALAYVGQCRPTDRERLLTGWWPDELRSRPAWVKAALATAASPELIDYYNERREPLLQALMDRPQLLVDVELLEIQPLSDVHHAAHSWRALEPVELLQSAGRWADATTVARRVEGRQPAGEEGAPGRRLAGAVTRGAELMQALAEGPPSMAEVAVLADAVRSAVLDLEASIPDGAQNGYLQKTLDGLLASATAAELLLAPIISDPVAAADELYHAAGLLSGTPSAHASGTQRTWIARAWQISALLLRYDAAVRVADRNASALLGAAKRKTEVLAGEVGQSSDTPVTREFSAFFDGVHDICDPGTAQAAWRMLAPIPPPICLVGTSLLPRSFVFEPEKPREEPARAVCVPTLQKVPVTDVVVVRPREVYHLGMTVRLLSVPEWADTCIVELVTTLGREALALPRYAFSISDGTVDEVGITLMGDEPLHCAVEQPISSPALDCPIQVRLLGDGHDVLLETAGCQRLRLRPFDPSQDALTEHEQTDGRLLAMFAALDAPEFNTEDVRAFCRLFSACVRAAQTIMFEKTFMQGSRVSEAEFHDELERRLRADPELEGRLTRRDAVAGGFDDLLHDDIIAELKVSHGPPVTVDACARYVGQPSQYAVGRGSQLSVLVVFDHGRKQAPPGVIDNYIDWLRPRLHGLTDPRYPTLVGVLIVNSNLPIPSAWSRRRVEVERLAGGDVAQN